MDLITHSLTAGYASEHSEFDCIQYPGMGPSHIQCSTFLSLPSDASPKAISGRTSYLRVRLEFLRYPQVIRQLFNGGRFGPPLPFTATSTCSWIGHPVSGLLHETLVLFTLGFPSAPDLKSLTLLHTITRRTILQKVPYHTLTCSMCL